MKPIHKSWLCLFLVVATLQLTAQQSTPDTLQPLIRKSSLVVLPLAFYTPETGFGGGAATLYAFRFRGQSDSTRPSQIQLGGAYTAENQVLSYLPFQLFFKNRTYHLYGEIGYYRYFYYFYGIGNDLPDLRERYNVTFPRVRLNALQMVYPNLSIGVRYWMDDFRIREREAGGQLETGGIRGAEGGMISGAGVVLNYDSRDNIFYASKGWNVEMVVLRNTQMLGSDFNFTRFSLDASTYLTNGWNHTLAINTWMNFNFGEVPFNEMAVIGGTRKMRGFFEGRYRDNHVWMLQGEYRVPPVWWRLGIVVFGGVGSVASEIGQFTTNRVHYSAGAGLRILISEREKVNLRIDYGINEAGQGFPYITVTEAF